MTKNDALQRTRPPFRADQVGSLLRSPQLKEARARLSRGEIAAAAFREIEDREVERVVRKQEEIGLRAVTDGELRRSWWQLDFFWGLQGVERCFAEHGYQFQGTETRNESARISGRIGYAGHPMLEHFRFLKDHTGRMAKATIPSPNVLHFRHGQTVNREIYPDLERFYEDAAAAYRDAIADFYDAGCRYLQLDDTVWAMLCDPTQRQRSRERGIDPDGLMEIYARINNAALAGRKDDMVVTMHACRGNFRSTWMAEGGYEYTAEWLFAGIDLDGYFLEYDSDRAGGFEPLRFLPKGNKVVVLGLVTTKSGALEKRDDILRRIDEATRYVDIDQLALSPQCGFASTEEGNALSEEEQWAKLRLVVEVAAEVWG